MARPWLARRRRSIETGVKRHETPYGTERSYNGLRLAKALAGEKLEVTVFLLADAVSCAKAGQKVP